jgi:hypothetical protein
MKFTGYEAEFLRLMIDSDGSKPHEAFSELVLKDNPDIRLEEYQKLFSDTIYNLEYTISQKSA